MSSTALITTTLEGFRGKRVEAVPFNGWAATPCVDVLRKGWCVTHLQTGLAASKGLNKSEAVAAARALADNLPDLTVVGTFEQIKNGKSHYKSFDNDEAKYIVESLIAEALAVYP